MVPVNYFMQLCFGYRIEAEVDEKDLHRPRKVVTDGPGFVWFITYLMEAAFESDVGTFYPWLKWLDPLHWRAKRLTKLTAEVFDGMIARYEASMAKGEALDAPVMEELLAARNAGTITQFNLHELLVVYFLAGVDTVNNVAGFFLQQLADRPEVQKMIQDELEQVVGESRFVDEGDMANLPVFK